MRQVKGTMSEFLESHFSSPDSESDTKSWTFTRPSPIPRPSRLEVRVRFRDRDESQTERLGVSSPSLPFIVQKVEVKMFKFFDFYPPPQNFDSESDSESKTTLKSSPIPRLRRVLSRETRYFKSETRDSGNSAIQYVVCLWSVAKEDKGPSNSSLDWMLFPQICRGVSNSESQLNNPVEFLKSLH